MTTVIASIDQQQARALTDRIKVAVEATWVLIQEAYTSRAWAVLGYDSWDAYCAQEFGSARLRLPREERQEVVASLRDSGLSTRAIGAATGVSHTQIRKDLQAAGGNPLPNSAGGALAEFPPERVTGVDGKSYEGARRLPDMADEFDGGDWIEPAEDVADDENLRNSATPASESPAEPAKPKRRPITEAYFETLRDYTRASERLQRLTQDDRFNRNRDQTHHYMPELLTALGQTAELLQAMNLPETTASEEARRWWATSLNNLSDTLAGVANQLTKEQ